MKTVIITLSDGNVIVGEVQSEDDSEMICRDTNTNLLFTVEVTYED